MMDLPLKPRMFARWLVFAALTGLLCLPLRSANKVEPWVEVRTPHFVVGSDGGEKGARRVRPDPEDLSVLWESPLLPLDIVLQADRTSPYYTNGSKDTVYFAESRALVHFLLTDAQAAGGKPLDRYVSQVENGADPLQTAR